MKFVFDCPRLLHSPLLPLLQLTLGDCTIELSVLKLCLRGQIPFELGLLISYR